MSDANPFRPGTAAPAGDDSTARPFAAVAARAPQRSNLKAHLNTKVKHMDLGGVGAGAATGRAGELTVKDLNDLAAEFSGIRTGNVNLAELTIEDLNSLEAVFFDVKMSAAKAARQATAAPGGETAPIFDNWSCCCCTPCCCCAVAETDPFSA